METMKRVGGGRELEGGKYGGDTAAPIFHKKVSCAQRNINLNIVNVPCLFRNLNAAHSLYVIIKFYLLISHPLLSSSPCSFICLHFSFYPKIYFLPRVLKFTSLTPLFYSLLLNSFQIQGADPYNTTFVQIYIFTILPALLLKISILYLAFPNKFLCVFLHRKKQQWFIYTAALFQIS